MHTISKKPKSTKINANTPFSAPNSAEPHKPAKSKKNPISPARIQITISHILRHLKSETGINTALPISIVKAGRTGKI